MRYSVIVDGPNLISRLIDSGLDNDKIANNFSLNNLLIEAIRVPIVQEFGGQSSTGLEYIYSDKVPGPSGKKLSKEQWEKFIERSSRQNAIYLNKINIRSSQEKGVDVAVAIRLVEVAETCDIICLVSSDNDYIPVLEYLKRKGKYICTVGLSKSHPIELVNLSYMFVDITNYLSKSFSN
ncbi:MAG: NYN domain-containing protein [Ignavibacteriaceae bacterium]|nr:NYN domain-containing protein [Ignavibacteriaceae bacterium]